MDGSFRPLKKSERDLLERLLAPRFPGRDELRAQLAFVTARELDDDGCLEFDCGAAAPAPVRATIPTEGECPDADGAILHVLLHVTAGFMKSLEMYKEDGSSPRALPAPSALRLFAPHSEDAGVWTRSDEFP